MQFTRLRVSGFKSFSDPSELQIADGLTGIVGPNGCGKSNIVDALRWVMGETSARGLRGTEMEDVIFSGSALRPAFDTTEVALRIRGPIEGPVLLQAGDEADIVRKLSRGAGSAYRIAGAEARARDVQYLLADAAAGARSAAIVGQGQISQVVDVRPDERRRMLEDAAGLSGLQSRRREAESRLRQTELNLERILDLLGTREARLEELRKQGKEAERYRRIAAELRAAETILLFRRRNEAEAEIRRARAAAAEALQAVETTDAAIAAARAERQQLQDRLAVARHEAETAGIELARLEERHRGEAARIERRRAEEAEQRARLAEAERDVAALTLELAELDQRASLLTAEQERLAREIAGLAATSALTEQESQDAHAALERATSERDRHLAEQLAAESAERTAETALGTARQRLEQLVAGAARLGGAASTDEADGAETALVAARQALAAATAAEAQAERRLAEQEGSLALTRTRHGECAEQRERLQRNVAEHRAAVGAAEASRAERRQRLELVGRNRERSTRRLGELQDRQERLARQLADDPITPAMRAVEAAVTATERRQSEVAAAEARFLAHDASQRAAEEEARRLAELAKRLQDELDGLAPLLAALDPAPVAGAVEGAEAWQNALAAALGDDLLAGTDPESARHWRQTRHVHPWIGDPPLPLDVEPLADKIAAPPQLQRRLQQVGVCDAATAEELSRQLAVGQRLVSLEGDLWRWDGYVRRAGADHSSVLLRQFHRRDQLVAEAAEAAARLREVELGLPSVRSAVTAAKAALGAARLEAGAAETALARQRAELARLEEAQARTDKELAGLLPEIEVLAVELQELDGELARLGPEQAPGTVAQEALDREEVQLQGVEAEWQALRRQLLDSEQAIEAGRRVVTSARGHTGATRQAVEQARQRHDEIAQARLRAELERDAELQRLLTERAETEAGLPALADAAERARASCEQARTARQVVEALVTRARSRRDEEGTRSAALRAEIAAEQARLLACETALVELPPRQEAGHARRTRLEERILHITARLEADREQGGSDDIDELRAELAAARQEQTRTTEVARGLAAELARLERATELVEAEGGRLRERSALAHAAEAAAGSALEGAILAIRERVREPIEASAASVEEHPALAALPTSELEKRLERLRSSRDRVGPVNLRADAEAVELGRQLDETRAEADDIKTAVTRLNDAIATLNREARERLLRVFETVEQHFSRLFRQLFGGGKAHLRLTDLEDPLNAGLDLDAMPPGKKLSHVSLLSGGEKTLAALALVFAFFLAKPSPLCVLDEVDAPLDDANVERVTALMTEIAATTGTRFLVVTHHPLTMARMDRLYGVTMIERGVSRIVSVALEEAVELRATA